MGEETEGLNLTDGQKTRLLGLALDPDKPVTAANEDEERGDLLCDMLRRPLPVDRPSREAMALGTDGSCQGLRSVLGPPLGELLQDPKTDIAVLRQIKERAKKLGEYTTSQVEKDVLLAVYFAAIAAALAFHDEWITRQSNHDLAQFFGSFAQAAWIPAELTTLFKKGGETLSSKP